MKNLFYPMALRCIIVIVTCIAGHVGIAQTFTEGAIPFGDADGTLIGDSDLLRWDVTKSTLKVRSSSIYLGNLSGNSITTGGRNSSIGQHSGRSTTTGSYNVFIGTGAGEYNQAGLQNVYIGLHAGRYNQGIANVYIGTSAGANNGLATNNRYAAYNNCIGYLAGVNTEVGDFNNYMGRSAGRYSIGSHNVFFGSYAGENEMGSHRLHINSSANNPTIYGHLDEQRIAIATTVLPNDLDYKFAVGGKAIAEEIKVSLIANWPDYVFEENYELMTIDNLQSYIAQHGHLPESPTERVLATDGLELGKMNA